MDTKRRLEGDGVAKRARTTTFHPYDLLWLKFRAMNDDEYAPDDEYPDDEVEYGGVPDVFKNKLDDLEFMNEAVAAMRALQAECADRHKADLERRDALWDKFAPDWSNMVPKDDWTEFKRGLNADERELFTFLGIETDFATAKNVHKKGFPRPANCARCFGCRHIPGGNPCNDCVGEGGGDLIHEGFE